MLHLRRSPALHSECDVRNQRPERHLASNLTAFGNTLTKLGTGKLTLTGTNTYSGATTVSGGTLAVNGSITSAVTVANGGTLGGTGAVGVTTVNAGGTLAPGNSIGTITVNGNLGFAAGSAYAVEVSPASSDRTIVTGTATLGGATVATSFEAGTYVAKSYTILSATSINGTFAPTVANTNLPSGFKTSLSYDATNAYLNLALSFHAEFNANTYSGRLEGGYRFVSQGIGFTPYAAAQVTTFALPAYVEQAIVGSNQFALAYSARNVTDTRSELGLRTDKAFAQADGIVTLRGRLAWAHDFNPNRAIGATFQTLPGASFTVAGAAMAADSALVSASAEKRWLNGWSAAATFEGEVSSVTRSYAGKGVVRYAW